MKIGPLLGGMLPLFLLVACGGDKPANVSSNNSGNSGAAKSSAGGSADIPANPTDAQPKSADDENTDAGAGQDAKKRIRRPRIDIKMVKLLLGNDGASPEAPVASTPELVALGKTLYHSELLSQKGNLSCASCHDLSTYGVDNKPVSPGSTGENGTRNTPTVYNASRQFSQFWDGRAESVEEQAIMPMINPIEHGLTDSASTSWRCCISPTTIPT